MFLGETAGFGIELLFGAENVFIEEIVAYGARGCVEQMK